MKKLITFLFLASCLHAQQSVTVSNNGSGTGTFNTPGINYYLWGPPAATVDFSNVKVLGISGSFGTVTSIAPGTGLSTSPNPIVGTGIISLADTTVTPGAYTAANITVNQQGQITLAANGGGAVPGGSSTQFQYNNAGAFGGTSGLTWITGTGTLFNQQNSTSQLQLLGIQNLDTGTTSDGEWYIHNGGGSLVGVLTSAGYSGARLSNGPTGLIGGIFTAGSIPLVFGTGTTAALWIDTSQNFTFTYNHAISSTDSGGTARRFLMNNTNVYEIGDIDGVGYPTNILAGGAAHINFVANNSIVGYVSTTGLNAVNLGATTAGTVAATTISATGISSLNGAVNVGATGSDGSITFKRSSDGASVATLNYLSSGTELRMNNAVGNVTLYASNALGATIATGGSVWGSATGGSEGAGTINAQGLYINGTPAGSGNTTSSGATSGQVAYFTGANAITSSSSLTYSAGNLGIAGITTLSNTTSASSATVGALLIGAGTAATNVAIGGGNAYFAPTATSGSAGIVSVAQLLLGANQTSHPTGTFTADASSGTILTGRPGSSNDLNIQNGTGGATLTIPTGTTNINLFGKITQYNNVATAGYGAAIVVAAPRQTAVTNTTATLATYTVPAVDSTYRVSANVQVTAATTAAMTVVCTYTDETNTSRAQTIPFCQLAGTFLTSITNVTGVGPYEGATLEIRCKASTTIVFTTAGTTTGITYNIQGTVTQLN